MRIGIDALFIRPGKVGGTESYLRNLIKGFEQIDDKNEYFILTTKSNEYSFSFLKNNFHKIICDINGENQIRRVIYTNLFLPSILSKLKLDILFFPTYIRPVYRLKNIITISNIHDIQYKHFPQYFSLLQKITFNLFYRLSLKKSDSIICISNFVLNDLIKEFPDMNKEKYKVIYNPIDFDKFDIIQSAPQEVLEKKFKLKSKKYILSVASLLPHKNILTLIDAFCIYKKFNDNDIKLVLVGVKEKSTNLIMDKIKQNNIANEVVIPGFIQDEELSLLYNNASLFISTSLFEGFGMPPVEAMYKKIPTITTKCASLPEVTLEKATYYDNPKDSNELANTIKMTLSLDLSENELNEVSIEIKNKYALKHISTEYNNHFVELFLHKNQK